MKDTTLIIIDTILNILIAVLSFYAGYSYAMYKGGNDER